jgi:DNA-binding beta-propeller fold protein YncE
MTPARHSHRFATGLVFASVLAAGASASAPAEASPSFTAFESGQVRPLALSADRKLLFAVNTPDNRLEIFRVMGSSLIRRSSVPVGLEPVSVAVRSSNEVWVVNHLSDSVSVVHLDTDGRQGRVVRTLLVGDEPRDIVFAGPGKKRAFITAAHRGQNIPFDPELTTPGVGRADVWVFNADQLGDSLTGNPLTVISLFSDTPRALAVSPSGDRVYAAAFHSGNRTTAISFLHGPELPPPHTNFEGIAAPANGLIVKWNGQHWVDELGLAHDDKVKFSLPDKDVFTIDAMAAVPHQLGGAAGFYTGVGTVLFNMAVNPVSGKVYVANTEARNEERFEGPGVFAGHSVRGRFVESRITVLGSGGAVTPRHLNKHINYSACCAPAPNAESEKSLAIPQGIAVSADGTKLYVAALGSSKVGVYSTSALENDTFVPSAADQINLSGGGPTGVALDDAGQRLFVLTRFDNSISVVNTATRAEVSHTAMHNPEPPSIVDGRKFLYDARLSSSHGDSSCASCHVYGDLDSLAWDLGDPDGQMLNDPGPFTTPLVDPAGNPVPATFHPMKGPMTTQSLRGMANHGPMHWRGDRTGGNDAPTAQPDSGAFDERAAFKKFQGAFANLLGRSAPLSDADMEAFTDFILQVTYPPNPNRALDNSRTPEQEAGFTSFTNGKLFLGTHRCIDCHKTDPQGNPGADRPGFFGAAGFSAFVLEPNLMKVPHLRNLYQKVGMFGFPEVPGFVTGDAASLGDQVRGFGFTHDGGADTIFRFHSTGFFTQTDQNPEGIPLTPEGDVKRRQLESFLLAFDSNMAPIVGQQVTLTATNAATAGPRLDLLLARANAGECDLIAKDYSLFRERGFFYVGAGQFMRDEQWKPAVSHTFLRLFAALPGHEVTFTCAPPGSGARLAVDRDGDGALDGDELTWGTDPADPSCSP